MSLQTYSAADVARRWQNAPELDPETERRAALATIDFLADVRGKLSQHLDDMAKGNAAEDGSDLHAVWDFSGFDPKHLDFLLPTIGEGEVKILLFNGEARAADTGVPGLRRGTKATPPTPSYWDAFPARCSSSRNGAKRKSRSS